MNGGCVWCGIYSTTFCNVCCRPVHGDNCVMIHAPYCEGGMKKNKITTDNPCSPTLRDLRPREMFRYHASDDGNVYMVLGGCDMVNRLGEVPSVNLATGEMYWTRAECKVIRVRTVRISKEDC